MSIKNRQIIKKLFSIFKINPRFFLKRIFLEAKSFILPLPKSPIIKKINNVSFEFDFKYSNKIKKMYFGNYQPIITETLRKYLKKGDTFLDVGACIGYFSMIGAGLVGKEGQVHSFEPVPEYFKKIDNFARINTQYNITVNQFALGDENKSKDLYVEGRSNIGNNTFFTYVLGERKDKSKAIQVPIRRLDEYIRERGVNNIKLIKIDVEGFEFPVLKGLSNYLSDCVKKGNGPIIICEVFPSLYTHLEYSLSDIFKYMEKFSYYPFEIFNPNKKIVEEKKILSDIIFKFCK